MNHSETEAFRHKCEVREWINRGYTDEKKLAELSDRVGRKRGAARAKSLIDDIRKEAKKAPQTQTAPHNGRIF